MDESESSSTKWKVVAIIAIVFSFFLILFLIIYIIVTSRTEDPSPANCIDGFCLKPSLWSDIDYDFIITSPSGSLGLDENRQLTFGNYSEPLVFEWNLTECDTEICNTGNITTRVNAKKMYLRVIVGNIEDTQRTCVASQQIRIELDEIAGLSGNFYTDGKAIYTTCNIVGKDNTIYYPMLSGAGKNVGIVYIPEYQIGKWDIDTLVVNIIPKD